MLGAFDWEEDPDPSESLSSHRSVLSKAQDPWSAGNYIRIDCLLCFPIFT